MHTDGFGAATKPSENFAFRLGRSRETAFSREYDELYELLQYERDHGYVVWVMGPCVFLQWLLPYRVLQNYRGGICRRRLCRQRSCNA